MFLSFLLPYPGTGVVFFWPIIEKRNQRNIKNKQNNNKKKNKNVTKQSKTKQNKNNVRGFAFCLFVCLFVCFSLITLDKFYGKTRRTKHILFTCLGSFTSSCEVP